MQGRTEYLSKALLGPPPQYISITNLALYSQLRGVVALIENGAGPCSADPARPLLILLE